MKSIIFGIIIGSVGITTVFAANNIKSAKISTAKVTLNGNSVNLNNPMISITKDNEKDASLYMPVRELLEHLGYTVNWNENKNTVDLTSSENVTSLNQLVYEGGIAANNYQIGTTFPAKNGDVITLSLIDELTGWQLNKDKISIKIVIGGNDGTTQEVFLSNKEPQTSINIKENAVHHITIYNTNNQLVNYKFLLKYGN